MSFKMVLTDPFEIPTISASSLVVGGPLPDPFFKTGISVMRFLKTGITGFTGNYKKNRI